MDDERMSRFKQLIHNSHTDILEAHLEFLGRLRRDDFPPYSESAWHLEHRDEECAYIHAQLLLRRMGVA